MFQVPCAHTLPQFPMPFGKWLELVSLRDPAALSDLSPCTQSLLALPLRRRPRYGRSWSTMIIALVVVGRAVLSAVVTEG